MKVIIDNYKYDSTQLNSPLNIWDPKGECYEGHSCEDCFLNGCTCHTTINAFVSHLIANHKITIPCTIDINDYPELSI